MTRCVSGCRKISTEHPRWGYRLAWGVVRDEGWEVNSKKIQRLWREEGLRVPRRTRKRLRLGDSTVPAVRLRSERPNHVWALDFQFDTTTDGRALKLLHIVDEHTREALAIRVARSIDAAHTVRVLDEIVRERGLGPELLRMDNGPEMTTGEPVANVLAAVARWERGMIGVRTSEALQLKIAGGWTSSSWEVRVLAAVRGADREDGGCRGSQRAIADRLNPGGVPAVGGSWQRGTVIRVLRQAET
jgi:hypothetical protein